MNDFAVIPTSYMTRAHLGLKSRIRSIVDFCLGAVYWPVVSLLLFVPLSDLLSVLLSSSFFGVVAVLLG